MGRSTLRMWLLEWSTHIDYVRVIFYMWLGAGLLATNNCVAQQTTQSLSSIQVTTNNEEVDLPTELGDRSDELRRHLYSNCTDAECIASLSLCSNLCNSDSDDLECFTEVCMSQGDTLTFVCGYQDAIVCADDHEICRMNATLPGKFNQSFCVCTKDSAACITFNDDSWVVDEGTSLTNSTTVLVIASCLVVVLVILVIVLICCVCRRWGTRSKRRSRTSTLKLDKPEDLEYAYAYGHRDRPLSMLPATDDSDLDADQIDHYYCHLKQEGRPNRQGKGQDDSGPGQKVLTQDKDDKESDITHTYFVQEKMSTDEPAEMCSDVDEKMSPTVDENDISQGSYREQSPKTDSGYEVAKIIEPTDKPKAQRHIKSSGYEVANEQRHGDVTTTASNQEEAPKQNRDSGYEVATVTSTGNGEEGRNVPDRHSNVTFELPNREQSPNMDSGYEVAKIIEPELQDEYDHLERNEPFKPREGAIP
ncbi:uncharacterized protein [Asterias amurensis]|uniref:uncharacterized protein n=1 Tax=Asterias amurensis TaxID=7602 RepID=UPI003AB34CC0